MLSIYKIVIALTTIDSLRIDIQVTLTTQYTYVAN
jgi:hypothetical protein